LQIQQTRMRKLDSKIIADKNLEIQLLELCEFSSSDNWKLIYRASEDGFYAKSFHIECDNEPNTLTIIKSKTGKIFGGFTQIKWDGDSGFKTDKEAFIFSLINKDNEPIKMKVCENKNAIRCSKDYGPAFGYDIEIRTCSNTNENSSSDLGSSFKHPRYKYGSEKAKTFLADSEYFQVEDIEVYQKL
jgi:hypothetical protein